MHDARNRFLKHFIVWICLLTVFVLADQYFNSWGLRDTLRKGFAKPATFAFERLGIIRRSYNAVKNFRQIAEENVMLKAENQKLLVERASFGAIVRENSFLRRAAGLEITNVDRVPVSASIYLISRGVIGYQVMLNRGSDDGILPQQAVITEEGVLVGMIEEVFKSTARLLLTSDPSFSATAHIVGTKTAGIAKGNGQAGLLLDLIVFGDVVAPRDQAVTSGDDTLPPGLILGSVDKIDEKPEQVFKKVYIKSAASDFLMGPVLVITRR